MAIAYSKRVIQPRPIEPGEILWVPATFRPGNNEEFWVAVTITRILGNGRFEVLTEDESRLIILGENLYDRRFR